jgi:ATP-dependent exoDNAse (exonuclease V) beta subunit
MSPRLQPFEANSFPLDCGIRLLEASAGTGKTFALAHLVLRLVTEEALSLRRLLVVTYTEAAAAELRDRIGRRLQEALASLAGLDVDGDVDGDGDLKYVFAFTKAFNNLYLAFVFGLFGCDA